MKLFLLCTWYDKDSDDEGKFLYGLFETQRQRTKAKKDLDFRAANNYELDIVLVELDCKSKPVLRGKQEHPPFQDFEKADYDEECE